MEALRGDRTSQMIAAAQRGYPNQVSGLQRQAVGRLGQLFAGGATVAPSRSTDDAGT